MPVGSKNTKIEEIYKNLSRQDKDGILSFLKCDLFNQSEIVIAIHLYLSEKLKKQSEINKVELYQTVFGREERYSDVKLRVFFTKLTKLIERYILVKNIDTYPLTELTILNQYYRKNYLHKNYSVFFNSTPELKFDSYEEFLLYDYVYAIRKLEFIHQEHSNNSELMRKQFNLVLNSQQKLSFFQTLKTECDFLNFAQKYRSDRDNSYEESIINQLIEKRDEQDIVFKAYILVYLLSKESNEEQILHLKEIVMNKEIQFETNQRAILKHTQNFCVRYINSGQSAYLNHLFDLLKLELKYFEVEGDLTSVGFRTITFCALQLGEIDWAEKFVETYFSKVNESERENNYNFNYARIYFEKKEYKLAMRQLLKVTYDHPFYASIGRILLIKCYYELNEEMPLLSCCNSLAQFLNRSKEFTAQRIENNLHFIKYVKSLQNNRLKNNKTNFRKLKDKIETSTVVEKEWLLKKINELI